MSEEDVQTRNQIGECSHCAAQSSSSDFARFCDAGCDDNGQHCNDTSFILAQTAGLQSGNIPIAISSGLRGPNCTSRPDLDHLNCTAWLMKTQFATCLPHEVRPEGNPWGQLTIPASPDGEYEETPTTSNVSSVMDAYGYGDPRCDVYRFWEPGFPIATTGANVLPLVVHCPPVASASPNGHVLVFFGSFGPKGLVNFQLAPELAAPGSVAQDAETGAQIAPVPQSKNFSFSLDKHSFRIVVVRSKTDDQAASLPSTSCAPDAGVALPPRGARSVLHIIVDDLRPELPSWGQYQIHAPHITRLAESGTVFTRAYCQLAVCSPSRMSFLTGRRPDHTRTWNVSSASACQPSRLTQTVAANSF